MTKKIAEETTMDKRTEINRRRLLRGMSALSIGLTTNVWKSSTAFGADSNSKAPMHFIGVFSPNGTVPSAFFSDSTAKDSPIKLGEILSPFESMKSNMMVLKGVEYRSTIEDVLGEMPADIYSQAAEVLVKKPGGPHMKGPGAFLTGGSLLHGNFAGEGGPTGWADRISIDQFLAQKIGAASRFPSMEFGAINEQSEPLRCISYSGASKPCLPVQDPWAIFTRMFGEGTKSPEALKQQIKDRRSVIDLLKGDISSLSSRLSSEDKVKLDAHLTGLRAIETQLAANPVQCSTPKMPEPIDTAKKANYKELGKLLMDLMILAHTCGFTQISTFMWSNAGSHQTFPWLDSTDLHHDLSHAGWNDNVRIPQLIKINKWYAEQVVYVLDRLKTAPSANGGTVFDNTILLWGNEMGTGNSHSHHDIPFVLAGGAGGYFKMGRSIQRNREPHNNLLVSIANAMGLPEVKSFGIPGICSGPMETLKA